MRRLLFAYEKKDSFIHRCDPLSKLIWVFCFSILSLLATTVSQQAVLLILVVIVAIFLAKISIKEAGLIVITFVVFAACWFLIQSALIGGTHIFVQVGFFKLTYEGMNKAGAVALRIVLLVLLARVFIGTTEPRSLGLALVQKWGFTYSVAFGIFFMMRLLPLFEQEFTDLQDARKIRATDVNNGTRGIPGKLFDYIKVLLTRGFRRAVVTSYSLESRAFRAQRKRTFTTLIELTWEGKLLVIVSIAITIALGTYLLLGK